MLGMHKSQNILLVHFTVVIIIILDIYYNTIIVY